MVVIKRKPRGTITAPEANMEEPFQEYEILESCQIDQNYDFTSTLQDLDGIVEKIDVSNVAQQEEDDAEDESISEAMKKNYCLMT